MTDLTDLLARAEQWMQRWREPSIEDAATTHLIRDLVAAVRALQSENAALNKTRVDVWENPQQWMRWCDSRVLERAEAAEQERDRLREALTSLSRSGLTGATTP